MSPVAVLGARHSRRLSGELQADEQDERDDCDQGLKDSSSHHAHLSGLDEENDTIVRGAQYMSIGRRFK